jgi:ComF family protein
MGGVRFDPSFFQDLLHLFFPTGCLACRDRIPPEECPALICGRCRSLLRPPTPPRCPRCDVPIGTGQPKGERCLECAEWPSVLRSARAAVVMEPPADALVHALKYGGWRSLAGIMGEKMAERCVLRGWGHPIVPVPTTSSRLRTRGYNQAEVLAQVVARECESWVVKALRRTSGRTQVRLTPRERRSNAEGSFHLDSSARSRIEGREVILVDDVLTTGATAVSAAKTLGEVEGVSVHLLTFARALPFATDRRRSILS